MQLKIFSIPIIGGEAANEELNIFLRSKKILQVEKQFVAVGAQAYWSFCVTWVEEAEQTPKQKGKIDYKEVLDKDSFERFMNLKNIRKKIAEGEGLPAYAIFLDEELAAFAKTEKLTSAEMGKVKSVGQKKIERYGKYFIKQTDEESQSSD